MLPESEIAKICFGRVIKSSFYNSAQNQAAGPHYAVVLDPDEAVAEELEKPDPTFYVAVISHNDTIDSKFILPVPPRTGLTGYVVCSWIDRASLAGITEVGPLFLPPEMAKVLERIREHRRQLPKS